MLKPFLNVCAVALLLLSHVIGNAALAQKVPSNDAFNLESFAGQVVYVDFWASWCGPCRASFPFMADLSREFGEELNIVAINVDENKDDAKAFLEKFEVPFNIVYDPEGQLAGGFELPGMPTSYLFDREGNLILRHIGFKKSHIDELRRVIAEAVNGSVTASHSD